MSDIDFDFGPSPRPGIAQCPSCSRFARVIADGQDSSPDSLDYWFKTYCSKCGVQDG